MNKILYTRPDGGVSIIHPVDQSKVEETLGPLSKEDYEAHVMAVSVPSDAINVTFIADEDIPEKDEFRNAWVHSESEIKYDLVKAKNIVSDKLRIEMKSHMDEKSLLTSLGRDARAVDSKISDLADKSSQLEQISMVGIGSKSDLSSLKSLLPTA